ncbi:uracil-DNA glycosylase family protein [Adhaeribacter soli]|uniref:SMUG2 DNA glycosylase family protein n=1 Tax=Adhaeribacter soli TaxID=2607655 RepID=A0A5N1IKB2_9BACT|nr:uracil-DNA glycosylase family protein [Adhaeribacter soli]KAA9325978.1 SMUG2 DNA glycosylase family protein [Adhaeribacter soli]
MTTFAEHVIAFNKTLDFTGTLPDGIGIMNPFKENPNILPISSSFYRKYYNDEQKRYMILGINPGRFGAGVTGVPFTDSKRLINDCQLPYSEKPTHEPSSVFVYDVIQAFGGPEAFYQQFYINSICPLGFTAIGKTGKEVNYNYYDSKELTAAVYDFIVQSIRQQLEFGINTEVCFCFGTGKNEKFLQELNKKEKFFGEVVALEHPRFVMQYKAKSKQQYIDKYLQAFARVQQ